MAVKRGGLRQKDGTTHNRVMVLTSEQANELARQWNCSKVEVYRWLVQAAIDGKIKPDEVKE